MYHVPVVHVCHVCGTVCSICHVYHTMILCVPKVVTTPLPTQHTPQIPQMTRLSFHSQFLFYRDSSKTQWTWSQDGSSRISIFGTSFTTFAMLDQQHVQTKFNIVWYSPVQMFVGFLSRCCRWYPPQCFGDSPNMGVHGKFCPLQTKHQHTCRCFRTNTFKSG